MFKKHLLTMLAITSSLAAYDDCCYEPSCGNKFYIGAFGGGLFSNKPTITQTGVAFFTEAQGGPLVVDAKGHSRHTSSGFGGVQLGYAFAPSNMGCSRWNFNSALELEAYWYSHNKKGDLFNDTDRLVERDFFNKFPIHAGVYLVNGVFTLNSACLGSFAPYIGGGIGAARLSIRHAESLQADPPEVGINHFNSDRNDSAWGFAAQAKVGLRYNVFCNFHIFAEYRLLYIEPSRYDFGSTKYPTHAPTSTWIVNINDMYYNAFAIGLQYEL